MVFTFADIDVCTAGVWLWRGELCGGQCGGRAESAHWRPMGSDLPRAAAGRSQAAAEAVTCKLAGGERLQAMSV